MFQFTSIRNADSLDFKLAGSVWDSAVAFWIAGSASGTVVSARAQRSFAFSVHKRGATLEWRDVPSSEQVRRLPAGPTSGHRSSVWRLKGGTEKDTLTLLDHINREKLALGSYLTVTQPCSG